MFLGSGVCVITDIHTFYDFLCSFPYSPLLSLSPFFSLLFILLYHSLIIPLPLLFCSDVVPVCVFCVVIRGRSFIHQGSLLGQFADRSDSGLTCPLPQRKTHSHTHTHTHRKQRLWRIIYIHVYIYILFDILKIFFFYDCITVCRGGLGL